MVRANFYVHFADGVFDTSIFSGYGAEYKSPLGKKFTVTSGLNGLIRAI